MESARHEAGRKFPQCSVISWYSGGSDGGTVGMVGLREGGAGFRASCLVPLGASAGRCQPDLPSQLKRNIAARQRQRPTGALTIQQGELIGAIRSNRPITRQGRRLLTKMPPDYIPIVLFPCGAKYHLLSRRNNGRGRGR